MTKNEEAKTDHLINTLNQDLNKEQSEQLMEIIGLLNK